MKPPRSDRPRGTRSGSKPFQKADRPQPGGSPGRKPGAEERAFVRPAGKPAHGGSHAAAAGKWRDKTTQERSFSGGKSGKTGESRQDSRGDQRSEGRPARAASTGARAAIPSRIQDRARESLTRERDPVIAQRPSRSGDSWGEARPAEARPAESRASETRPSDARQSEGRPAAAPRGAVWLYGVHAVQAALANPERRFRRLVTTEEGAAQLAQRLPRPWAIEPEFAERTRLDQMLGRDAVHQGIALLCDLLPQLTLEEALQRPGPVLVLDQVTDPRNIGAILRSAAAFGVACVILQDRHAPEETGSLAKAASGALETVPLLRTVNLARILGQLKSADCWVVGLDAEATAALSGPSFAGRRVALVLGAEGEGLRRLTRESCDELAMLPMPGEMESLNVSAATAVALYELTRTG